MASVGRPAGRFVYPEGDARPLTLIAGGIGITPLLAMFRHGVSADPNRPMTLLYSARREQDLAFLPELQLIVERHPQARAAITHAGVGDCAADRPNDIGSAPAQEEKHAPSSEQHLG